MYLRLLTLFLCFLLAAEKAKAQTVKYDTTVTQIITFESTDNNPSVKLKSEYKKNAIGIPILSWVQGYLPVYYERHLTDFMSIKAGIGISFRSFTNDLGMVIWNDGKTSGYFDEYDTPGESDIADTYESYKFRKPGVGFYASIAPKFYIHTEGMNGFSVYPSLEYKHFSFKTQLARTDVSTNGLSYYDDKALPRQKNTFQNENNRCLDFTVNIGGLYQTNNYFFVEWRLGAGVRKHWSKRLDVGANQITDRLVNVERNYSRIKPVFVTDIILGGLF